VTRRKRLVFTREAPLRGGSFRRVLRTQALRRGGCRAPRPHDRPPAVPAVSRCRARQHHGQAAAAVTLTPGAPDAVKMSQQWDDTPRIVQAGPSSLKGAPSARRLLRKRRPLTLEPLPAQRA
jgi:hypothetical protein